MSRYYIPSLQKTISRPIYNQFIAYKKATINITYYCLCDKVQPLLLNAKSVWILPSLIRRLAVVLYLTSVLHMLAYELVTFLEI